MKINIVLFHPEIPQNTANIIRTCVGIDATLHLIKPYGFDLNLSEKVFKRGSTNYVDFVEIKEYDSFEEFEEKNPYNNNYCLITRYGKKTYDKINTKDINDENIYLIFGNESSGIEKNILEKYIDNTYRIPTTKTIRSLNLSNCAMTIAYEILRQLDFNDLVKEEPHKKNYL